VLGLRARNQHIERDAEGQAIKLRLAEDILDRFAVEALQQQFSVSLNQIAREFIHEMRHQPRVIFSQQMQQQ
jgi:hypothetical protein